MRRFIGTLCVLLLTRAACAQQGEPSPSSAAPQSPPFVMHLPAGASLISSPVDAGSGLARDAFLGLPRNYSLFFGWDGASQEYVDPDKALLGIGAGYWVYNPVPTTLTVSGQPYSQLQGLSKEIGVGWHLFGVPFAEGIDWHNVHFYESGNPIGLQTAFEMGLIDAEITTMKGSELRSHVAASTFEPGAAYWIYSKAPLSMRAERKSASASSAESRTTLSSRRSPFRPLGGGETVGWLSEIAEGLSELGQFGKAVAEAKPGEAVFAGLDMIGAAFGVAHYGLETSNKDLMEKLTDMDQKLDEIIVAVGNVSAQLDGIEKELQILEAKQDLAPLKAAKDNAEVWIDAYYKNASKSKQSYQWGSYMMAGCIDTSSACPNAVTTESFANFKKDYYKSPLTDDQNGDFIFWWANSVLGTRFSDPGSADILLINMYQQMTKALPLYNNGLAAYAQFAFNESPCALNISDKNCDLYEGVYKPLESLFLTLVGDQMMLAAAVVEAKGIKAEADPSGGSKNDAYQYIGGVQAYINEESEAFLKVVEQIALYRAADGRFDWNHFGASDAGQLLARADFVVAHLAGPYYRANPEKGFVNAPWPCVAACPTGVTPFKGVVGRVFYAQGETIPTATRNICKDAACSQVAGAVAEAAAIAVQGGWPYFLYDRPSGQEYVSASAYTNWHVRRLVPVTLPVGSYYVASGTAARGTASVTVLDYDGSYNNPPQDSSEVVSFGSFNGLEGALGHYGLDRPVEEWKVEKNDQRKTHAFSWKKTGTGYMFSNCLCRTPYEVTSTYTEVGDWKVSLPIRFAKPDGFPNLVVHWPTGTSVNLNSEMEDHDGDCDHNYYNELKFWSGLYKGDTVVTNKTKRPCLPSGAKETDDDQSKFQNCNWSCNLPGCDWTTNSDRVPFETGTTYSLKAAYHDKLYIFGGSSRWCYYYRDSWGSSMNVQLDTPSFSLAK